MKLASLKHGRDGTLTVASRDGARVIEATDVAPTLQAALDQWAFAAPKLRELFDALATGRKHGKPLDFNALASPLPRAYQWADGSAYLAHVELVRKSRGAEMPASFWTDPLMYQGGSDSFLGPRDPIAVENEDWGIDFEAEVAVVTDDVPMGIKAGVAAKHIQLLMLVNDVSLRALAPAELAKGFGFFHAKPSSAFSPLAVTPDELGDAWREGKVHLPLRVYRNGRLVGEPDTGIDMAFSFPELIAHAAKTRPLSAGTIIGSGTVSNKGGGKGSCCLAEVRMLETLRDGKPATPFLRFGDTVKIEMLDAGGNSIFGAIEQTVVRYRP